MTKHTHVIWVNNSQNSINEMVQNWFIIFHAYLQIFKFSGSKKSLRSAPGLHCTQKPALRYWAPMYSKARSPLLSSIVLNSLFSALGFHCTLKPALCTGAPLYSKACSPPWGSIVLKSLLSALGLHGTQKFGEPHKLKIIPCTIRGSNSGESWYQSDSGAVHVVSWGHYSIHPLW